MEKYEPLGVVGEGSYGVVLKCKQKDNGRFVAIKKFIDSEDDQNVRKIALREIRVLRKLRHENLVNLIEVFRRRKHLYLVFEFIDHTLLDEMENKSHGLDDQVCRKYIYQILRGVGFCHDNSIIHRDVKPENVLVSSNGIVKLCDFGFARNLCAPGEQYTDYVATRWYRAPELLVSDVAYGKEVDIWAVGCLFAEMMSGEPLFPGDSDIDQLFLIAQCLGKLSKRHLSIMSKNSAFQGFQFPKSRTSSTTSTESLIQKKQLRLDSKTETPKDSQSFIPKRTKNIRQSVHSTHGIFARMFPSWSDEAVEFVTLCLDHEPSGRPGCNALLRLPYFTHDNFPSRFMTELNEKLRIEGRNPIPAYSTRKKRTPSLKSLETPPGIANDNTNANPSTERHPPRKDFQKTQILFNDKSSSNSIHPKNKNPKSSFPPTKNPYHHPREESSKVTPGQNQTITRNQTFTIDTHTTTTMSSANNNNNSPTRKFSFAFDNKPHNSEIPRDKPRIPPQEFSIPNPSKYSDHYIVKSRNLPSPMNIKPEYFPQTINSENINPTTTRIPSSNPTTFIHTVLPTSKSTPNISSESSFSKPRGFSQNPEIQFAVKEKRFSLQNVMPETSSNLSPQIHRKFSYSFQSTPNPADNSSRSIQDFNNISSSNKSIKTFHHLPVTTLAFNLYPDHRVAKGQASNNQAPRVTSKTSSSNNGISYPQIKRSQSPQKLKTFSTNNSTSTYFPQTHHNNNNSNGSVIASGYSMIPRGSLTNQNSSDFKSYINTKPVSVFVSGSSLLQNSGGNTIGEKHSFLPQVNSSKTNSASYSLKDAIASSPIARESY